jgi:hypothetical protein
LKPHLSTRACRSLVPAADIPNISNLHAYLKLEVLQSNFKSFCWYGTVQRKFM